MPVPRRLWMLALALATVAPRAAVAVAPDGREIYAHACASCHGADGRGRPDGARGDVAVPDFTDCEYVTGEETAVWTDALRDGGHGHGPSTEPAAALRPDEIRAVLAYVRAFCADPAWPLGDLNYRRLQRVTKAFPEDEVVVEFGYAAARDEHETEVELEFEKRIGARGWIEVGVPVAVVDRDGEGTVAGVGDVGVSYSHVLAARAETGSILSTGAEIVLPVGNRRHGVGSGTVVVVPRLLAGQRLGPLVAQAEIGADLPADTDRAARRMSYALGIGVPLGSTPRALVPAIELEQTHALYSSVAAATLLTPQLYVPLSRSGHVAFSVGATVPVAGERPFDWTARAFVVWDWEDGPLWDW